MFLDGEAGQLTREQMELLKKGGEATEGMIVMVNDILNAERLAKNQIAYDFQKHDFIEIVKGAASFFDEATAKKNIAMELDFPAEKIIIVCDEPTMKIAIESLIGNAIHYSPEKSKIIISLCRKNGLAEFSIKDEGMGIPSGQQKKIFRKFFRADNAVRSQKTGSGLGLYAAKSIIKAHKGKIWFTSEENEGTKFYISLNAA